MKGNHLSIINYLYVPGPENNTPPATLFYKHKIRTLIPSMNTNVSQKNRKLISPNSTQHQKTLPPLKVSYSVCLHDRKNWALTGKIIKNIDDIP